MTTPRDLVIVAMDMPSSGPVEHGDLSLALAGAEAVDLLGAGAIRVADGRLVPVPRPAGPPAGEQPADPLLAAAAAALVQEPPYEPLGDWLWRRGRGLARTYLDAMQENGLLVRENRRRWLVVRNSRLVLVDSAARRRAHHRRRADEPVLATLAAAIGVVGGDAAPASDEATASVLGAVADAVAELSAERQRRARRLEDAAADNVRRGY
ncbi:GPP34 family phosphoprotein [Streptomyces sp. NPDC020917]|uniref:GPP34 family phosphoprotein n=1 Tax=Streptomyces sp. NPDC020917 TaxID=3365102 RepID=UPI00379E2C7D